MKYTRYSVTYQKLHNWKWKFMLLLSGVCPCKVNYVILEMSRIWCSWWEFYNPHESRHLHISRKDFARVKWWQLLINDDILRPDSTFKILNLQLKKSGFSCLWFWENDQTFSTNLRKKTYSCLVLTSTYQKPSCVRSVICEY